uniref:Formylglycine-generating enzyme, required for sulfatase activity, contains SUMF1/FGE domain n=1 Tax=Candidatus Kentrum sp. TUN TaxID=2126343 RepID=A0A450ZI58_9GAMM|nr:MAG: Formylglycine-generating enzyme, required for sulfatase activity, contains SUMF1/FGE domain [Candidatus Kentron sp. TUN]VFK54648.1 MAG: Formylglycine-generating enzyme, required for sulfatase activity, contains SUMF1/FGE domain [Candidatus Kentron sp. TUN]
MNPFDEKSSPAFALNQAKRRQRRFYLMASAGIFCTLLMLVGMFVVSKGTRIEILPKEAGEIAEINIAKGIGLCIGDTVYSLSSAPTITALASGFKTKTEKIPPENLGRVFPMALFELPGHLTIETSSRNKKTRWAIDGRDVAIASRLDKTLEAGTYIVTIDDPYAMKKEIDLELRREERKHLRVDLEPLVGVLEISSRPVGATLFLNGEEVGATPLRIRKNAGEYAVRLMSENHMDIRENIQIERLHPLVRRDYRMALKKGRISVSLAPPDGSLLLNGIEVEAARPLLVDAMTEHHLVYMRPGYFQETQTHRLSPDETRKISFRLVPEIGQVKITSSPAAQVRVDGKRRGVSPMTLALSAIPHKITLEKPGYLSVSKTIKPTASAVQEISITLSTPHEARLKNAPKEYTNTSGIRLKLFLPDNDKIIMGAARHEKGQRANEFVRTVRLRKPFYAGVHEVTNAQFRKFNTTQSTPPSTAANRPVTSLGWLDAAAYCNWLSRAEKRHPFYKINNGRMIGFDTHADGYRLLSEAEWEWLARKSGRHNQTIFSWGDKMVIPPRVANVADESAKGQVNIYIPNYTDGYAGVAPVGSFNREKSGLYDLAGNVSEWVHDFYSITPPATNKTEADPLGRQQGRVHVIKGANWRSGTITELRPAFREGLTAGRDDLGFRIGRYL